MFMNGPGGGIRLPGWVGELRWRGVICANCRVIIGNVLQYTMYKHVLHMCAEHHGRWVA